MPELKIIFIPFISLAMQPLNGREMLKNAVSLARELLGVNRSKDKISLHPIIEGCEFGEFGGVDRDFVREGLIEQEIDGSHTAGHQNL